jgi:hypothetical protein
MATGVRVGLGRAGRSVTLVVLAAFLAVFVALLPGVTPQAHADTEDDSLLVYCLSPVQRAGLLDAAVALGFAQRDKSGTDALLAGRPLDPTSWHREHSADFLRTCKALFAAQREPEPGVFASVLPFLTGLLGALLAFIAATWRDRVARGHTLAYDLRSAFEEYRRAVETYLDSWHAGRSDTALIERRDVLLVQLARARGAHWRWRVVREVAGDVESKQFDQDGQSKEDALTWLHSVRDTVLRIADALERPIRPHRDMRAKSQS